MRRNTSLFEALDTMEFVDVPKVISNYKTRLYMGRGIEFKHNNPKIHEYWHHIEQLNNFTEFMFIVSRMISENGGAIVSISRNINGDPLVNVANPYYASGVETSYCSSDMAVIIESTYIDNSLHLIRSVYDTEKIVRTVWSDRTRAQINMYEFVSKLPSDKQLDYGTYDQEHNAYVLYHNMGVVPCELLLNKPYKQFFPMYSTSVYYQSPYKYGQNDKMYNYSGVSDTANCKGLILQLQNVYTQMNKLIVLDKPRIAVSNVNEATWNQMKKEGASQAFFNDLVFRVGGSSGINNGATMSVMSPTNSLDHYQNQIVATWIDIFKACGLSYQTQSGTQKTAQESTNSFSGSVEELNYLRIFLTRQWMRVIVKMFKIAGIELGDSESWSFQVKKNIITDEANKLDNLIKELQIGTKTPVDIISIIEGIDHDNAEQVYKSNSDWFKANDYPIATKDQGKGVSGVKGPDVQQGGRPTNESKQ